VSRPFEITTQGQELSGLGHELYNRIGGTYTSTRRSDPHIAAAIHLALGDAGTVLNVGAGAGNYEPVDREVVALEPSPVMIAQRPPGAAPVIEGRAEALPFPGNAFDAVMAVLSDHHWRDRRRGLAELRRVARRRVVLFNANPGEAELFWLTTEYLPEFLELIPPRYRHPRTWQDELRAALGRVEITPVPIPHDCADGFYGAYWRRPEAYLDSGVRAGISVFAQVSSAAVGRAVDALDADLKTGRWQHCHRELLTMDELHLGYYVIVAEPTSHTGGST
jgi:SAM-dependent methyltransferase